MHLLVLCMFTHALSSVPPKFNPMVHFWLHHTVPAHRLCACTQVVRQGKGWDRGRWVGSLAGCCADSLPADCKRAMVSTGWANSHPGCMNRLVKCYILVADFSIGKRL